MREKPRWMVKYTPFDPRRINYAPGCILHEAVRSWTDGKKGTNKNRIPSSSVGTWLKVNLFTPLGISFSLLCLYVFPRRYDGVEWITVVVTDVDFKRIIPKARILRHDIKMSRCYF